MRSLFSKIHQSEEKNAQMVKSHSSLFHHVTPPLKVYILVSFRVHSLSGSLQILGYLQFPSSTGSLALYGFALLLSMLPSMLLTKRFTLGEPWVKHSYSLREKNNYAQYHARLRPSCRTAHRSLLDFQLPEIRSMQFRSSSLPVATNPFSFTPLENRGLSSLTLGARHVALSLQHTFSTW